MTGGENQITPDRLYQNPVAYLDNTEFPYNYAKYGLTPSSEFVLHADVASYVRFLSTGSDNTYDLAKRVDGKVVLQTSALAQRFAATEASGAIKNYIIVLDNIPLCFPTTPIFAEYGQVAMPANLAEWTTFITDLCGGIKNILGDAKANKLWFRMGTEAHNGQRYLFTDPNVMLNFYKITAQAVKSVLPQAKFGPYNTCNPGVPSSQLLQFPVLAQYCIDNNLPLDFIGYSWYLKDAVPATNYRPFADHWNAAEIINPDLKNVPIEFHEFGILGTNGDKYVRPSCDNAAGLFKMLIDSKDAGLTGTFHWPVDVNISSPSTNVMNGLGWMFQVLDHTTGGDAYKLDNKIVSGSVGGSRITALGVFHCDNSKNYLIVSSFNPTLSKFSVETVKVTIPKSYINLKEVTSVSAASLDRSNCPLLAIRNDLQAKGYLSTEYVGQPYVTNYTGVHGVLVNASVTNVTQAKNYITTNKDKYTDLCKSSFTLQNRNVVITQTTAGTYEIEIPVKANSMSAILLEENTTPAQISKYLDNTTGINDVKSLEQLNAYPNPSFNGIFNLRNSETWEVYSTLGQKILSGESSVIDLSDFNKGLYLLKTKDGIDKLISK
jgi:hypothetical protein